MTAWMNRDEVDDALLRVRVLHRKALPELPNLLRAVETLHWLVRWTDANSDGWPYWEPPSRAASKLTVLISSRLGDWGRAPKQDVGLSELATALTPVKVFLTRQGVDWRSVLP